MEQDSSPDPTLRQSRDSNGTGADEISSVHSSHVPADNGMHYFLLAAEIFGRGNVDVIAEMWRELGVDAWSDPEIQALILASQEAFDAIRAGLEVGNIMLPFLEDVFDEPLPYLPTWRVLARLMAMEAEMHMARGDYGSAIGQYLALIEFGNESPNGGSAIHGLVGYVMRDLAAAALRDAIAVVKLPPDDYRMLIDELFRLDLETFSAAELQLGEAENLDLWLEDQENPLEAIIQRLTDSEFAIDLSAYTEQELETLWVEFLEHRERVIDYGSLPYYEVQNIDFDGIFGDNLFSTMVLPTISNFARSTARSKTQVLGTAVVAAIELYHADNSVYPTALSTLSPSYLVAVPSDPFTGADFLYRRNAAGYVLYSTGADMTDHGGSNNDWGWEEGTDMVLHDD